jgi:hypothetical protein
VRWIETQDLLFIEEAAGGLGVERFVEIGVKSAPTVAGLATNTLKLPEYAHSTVEVLNSERDAAVLFANDTDPEPELEVDDTPAPAAAPSGGPRPDDLVFDAADATTALIALSAKIRIDQIEALDSIESITDGASSRRNQMLVDLGSELNLGAIDGAAEADLAGLKGQVTKLARTYKPFGPVLSDAINDQLRTVFGPSGKRPAYIAERVKKTWELADGWVKHATVEVALGTREGSSVRGGALGGLHDGALADAASVDKAIDAAVAAVGVEARVSENIGLDLWRKLSFIVPMNVASGLTRGPVGEMLSTERGRALLSGVVAEIAAVSRVAGTALDEAEEARIRKDVLALPYSTTPSFLADLVRGGPTELDMLVGAVSRMGNEHGVPTPIHDFATTAFEAATAPKQA